jgi:peptide/nickel transport system permease protein
MIINLAPNSFVSGGELNPNISKEAIDHLKSVYGLDKSLLDRFIDWFLAVVRLDFGISFVTGNSVQDEILNRLPTTLIINSISLFLIFIISISIGIYSAFNSKFDKISKELNLISFSIPTFYLALVLLMIFAVEYKIFPLSGLHSSGEVSNYYLDYLWHLVLPIFVMVFGGFGSFAIYIRSLTIDILKSDYIFFAKTRGFNNKIIIFNYVIPNLMPYIITSLGLSLPALIGGSIILESIFSIDGMGLLFYKSAMSRDYPLIMGILVIGAFLTILGNLLADMLLYVLNPNFRNK